MGLRIFPREERFFDLFVEDAANVLAAARQLEEMLRGYDTNREQKAKELFAMEHHGDELTHGIGRRLNVTFVTPVDREDIIALITGLDDVLDLIEEVADTFILYRIDAPTEASVQQATIIVKQCETLHEALTKLSSFSAQGLEQYWIEVHRLENEGDRVVRGAVASLFADDNMKATDVVKWKDVYALLEDCIDKCEDVANIIERIVVKHA
jgi:predicted phosphate transport protein (TIGR00153 family)